MFVFALFIAISLSLSGCRKNETSGIKAVPQNSETSVSCGGPPLEVRFFDVKHGLSVLVRLPDGRHILVDTGDAQDRMECGNACKIAHRHLLEDLKEQLGKHPIDLMWITHQHSDHIGGALDILQTFTVKSYIDNGTGVTKPTVRHVHKVLESLKVETRVVSPERPVKPLADLGDVRVQAVLPKRWTAHCEAAPNDCSIGLRIDYCKSSVLFVGDAEIEEERLLSIEPVTLLQVGHHGSETSSSGAFLAMLAPKYAVISVGKDEEGLNRSYCHPARVAVERLNEALGGVGGRKLKVFRGTACRSALPSDWVSIPASDRLWATSRDGDIKLVTTGDGVFVRD